jgi:hypothetical protein
MKRSSTLMVAFATALSVAACDGLKEAFTAHVDIAARAERQELSTERLAGLIGRSTTVPIQSDVIRVVADLWVSYHLLGVAAARGDSLNDPELIEEAMWAQYAQVRTNKLMDSIVRTTTPPDTAGLEQRYLQGGVLASQHILVGMPQGGAGMSPQMQDSIRSVAEGIRARVTTENFSELVTAHSDDDGSKEAQGSYVFTPGEMVPEFEQATRSLQPGQIAPGLVQTQHGFHIVRRHLLSEVRDRFIAAISTSNVEGAQNAYIETLADEARLAVRPVAAARAREVATDPNAALSDRTVLVSGRRGDFTAARLAEYILAFPPGHPIRGTITNDQLPDSNVSQIVRNFAIRELIVAEADRARIEPDSADIADIHSLFATMVATTWQGLRIDPSSLGDSAQSQADRERLSARRVEAALDQLFETGGAMGFIDVPQPLGAALRSKYSSRVNVAGLERALERATQVRSMLDSTRANQPMQPPAAPPAGSGGTGQ